MELIIMSETVLYTITEHPRTVPDGYLLTYRGFHPRKQLNRLIDIDLPVPPGHPLFEQARDRVTAGFYSLKAELPPDDDA